MRIRRDRKEERAEFETTEQVRAYIKQTIRVCLEGDVPPGLPPSERKKYRFRVQQLRHSLRACVYGDDGEKAYVKHHIMHELEKLRLTVREREKLLPLHAPEKMDSIQKFRILLYRYMKQYGKEGFRKLCELHGLPRRVRREDGTYYEITEEDISHIYEEEHFLLSNTEIMEILCEEVYEGFGHGVIDKLRDCRLEGISGGVAGIPEHVFQHEGMLEEPAIGNYAHDSIFVMLNGVTIRLAFLSFGNEKELRRVTKSLIRFEATGELSYYHPYVVNDMKDGSRVFACRPPFSESWAFFVRKFDSVAEKKVEELVVGDGAERMITAIKFFVRGGLHIAITGAQGSGKTTLMKAMVRYISPGYNLRIEESVFELWMRKEFPRRNILTFQETESVNVTEGLDAFRKTDGNCLMMGEIGNIQAAALMIELSQVSEQQLFTHHAMTTEKLLGYFRNALLRTGTYSDERMAKEQVAEAFDIHILCEKDLDGRRYIKQISEIVSDDGGTGRILYRYSNGRYEKVGVPTRRLLHRMWERAEESEKEEMEAFFAEV